MQVKFHSQITAHAIRKMVAHRQKPQAKWLRLNKKHVKKGSQIEDYWPPVQRYLNWHFFASNPYIDDDGIKRHTSEGRVGDLVKTFERQKAWGSERYFLFRTVGRILHHIQDMSCPAHVMPIYHADWLLERKPDRFEDRMDRHYKHYCFDRAPVINDSLFASKKKVIDIYTDLAKATIEYVNNTSIEGIVDDRQQPIPLTRFWKPYGSNSPGCHQADHNPTYVGFSTYGDLCNHFGDLEFKVKGQTVSISQYEYDKVYKALYVMALEASVETLATLDV